MRHNLEFYCNFFLQQQVPFRFLNLLTMRQHLKHFIMPDQFSLSNSFHFFLSGPYVAILMNMQKVDSICSTSYVLCSYYTHSIIDSKKQSCLILLCNSNSLILHTLWPTQIMHTVNAMHLFLSVVLMPITCLPPYEKDFLLKLLNAFIMN